MDRIDEAIKYFAVSYDGIDKSFEASINAGKTALAALRTIEYMLKYGDYPYLKDKFQSYLKEE